MRDRPLYYDRLGLPMDDVLDLAKVWGNDRTVVQSRHKENGVEFWLSTVYLAIDHQYGSGPPLIFETMAFEITKPSWDAVVGQLDMGGIFQDRYSSEEQARAGHKPGRVELDDR